LVTSFIWTDAAGNGGLRCSENVTTVYDETFTVFKADGTPRFDVSVAKNQSAPAYSGLTVLRLSAGTAVLGDPLRSSSTRGGIRGPEGMTLAPFSCQMIVQ